MTKCDICDMETPITRRERCGMCKVLNGKKLTIEDLENHVKETWGQEQ